MVNKIFEKKNASERYNELCVEEFYAALFFSYKATGAAFDVCYTCMILFFRFWIISTM